LSCGSDWAPKRLYPSRVITTPRRKDALLFFEMN